MKKLTIELDGSDAAFLKRAVPLFGTEEAAALDCVRSTRERVERGADKVALDLAADIGNDAAARMIKTIRAELKKEFCSPPSVQRCEMVVDWKLAADGESPGDEIECGKPAVARNGHVSMCGGCVKYGFEQGNFEPHELLPLQGNLLDLCEANAELGLALVAAKNEKCFGCDVNERHVKEANAERDALRRELGSYQSAATTDRHLLAEAERLRTEVAQERADREKTEDALLSTNNERKDAKKQRDRLVFQITAIANLDSAAGVAHKLRVVAERAGRLCKPDRHPDCTSQECQIRNACTGAAACTWDMVAP